MLLTIRISPNLLFNILHELTMQNLNNILEKSAPLTFHFFTNLLYTFRRCRLELLDDAIILFIYLELYTKVKLLNNVCYLSKKV